ncbi:MAG: sodium-dependent transporter [Bacteroidales bacterium]
MPHNKRGLFGSKFGIIAATVGSAVGLGNIWRFPYVAGENGGGAFLIVYLFFVLAIGIPVLFAELIVGRSAHSNAVGSFKKLAPGKSWHLVGAMGVIASFMILSYYLVIAGWTLEYLYQSIANNLAGKSTIELKGMFDSFVGTPSRTLMWFFVFMLMNVFIISAGVEKGIERFSKFLMPLLVLLLIVIGIRSVTLEGGQKGLEFLFKPDFSKVTTDVVLEALGQAFFSLSIGMGAIITYGSYIRKKDNLGSTAFTVAIADTLIAVLAGVAIFPAVFAFGIDPAEGTNLIFTTVPNVFQKMAGGYIFSILFFLLIAVAALTSTLSLFEVITSYLIEEFKMNRKTASIITATAIVITGSIATLSSNHVLNLKIFNLSIFNFLDYVTANIMLPLGGLLIVIFVGWIFKKDKVLKEIRHSKHYKAQYIPTLMFIIKFIAPVAITIIFVNKMLGGGGH